MTAVVDFIPDLKFNIEDLDRFLFECEVRFKQREVMHRKEAADFIGINIRTLDRLATEGHIPYHKLKGLEGTRLFLRSELIEHIKKH